MDVVLDSGRLANRRGGVRTTLTAALSELTRRGVDRDDIQLFPTWGDRGEVYWHALPCRYTPCPCHEVRP